MSYDVYLRGEKKDPCVACGRPYHEEDGPDLPGPTYNLTPIFDLALTGEGLPSPNVTEASVVLFGAKTDRPRGLRLLSGKRGRATIEWLEKAVGHLEDPAKREAFVALEPPNKWGTLPDALSVMERLLQAARDFPDHTWEVH